jgi:phosphoribosyl-dephospho-CoA transferase
MPHTFRPHDLLWLADAAALRSPEPLPEWLAQAWRPDLPVVVRRAPAAAGQVAIGIRGGERSQRCGLWADVNAVTRVATPESLFERIGQVDPARLAAIPALQALAALTGEFGTVGLAWGVTGSAGFELASGLPVLRSSSDLDLLTRCPQAPERPLLQDYQAVFARQPCRIDVQLETPLGAVALVEWLRAPREVLVKTSHGPRLVTDPWQPQPAKQEI